MLVDLLDSISILIAELVQYCNLLVKQIANLTKVQLKLINHWLIVEDDDIAEVNTGFFLFFILGA